MINYIYLLTLLACQSAIDMLINILHLTIYEPHHMSNNKAAVTSEGSEQPGPKVIKHFSC